MSCLRASLPAPPLGRPPPSALLTLSTRCSAGSGACTTIATAQQDVRRGLRKMQVQLHAACSLLPRASRFTGWGLWQCMAASKPCTHKGAWRALPSHYIIRACLSSCLAAKLSAGRQWTAAGTCQNPFAASTPEAAGTPSWQAPQRCRSRQRQQLLAGGSRLVRQR